MSGQAADRRSARASGGSEEAVTAIVAVVMADVIGSRRLPDRDQLSGRLEATAERLNGIFATALLEPFRLAAGDELRAVFSDPPQAPLAVSIMREELAPVQVRVGVGLGPAPGSSGATPEAAANAQAAIDDAKRQGGVLRYRGAGAGQDILLNAVCRLVDPLVRERTPKQWQAIAAYRRHGHQRDVAALLGVTRQSVGDRLAAGHRREVEEADAAIAAYLTYRTT